MNIISSEQFESYKANARKLLERQRFAGLGLEQRLVAWEAICKRLFYNGIGLFDAAVQASHTVKGLKIGSSTLRKLKIGELEALRRAQKAKLPKVLGQEMSRMQRSLTRKRRVR